MLKISIPTPCHEDWNKMTPDETGRHCCSCAKSVVDFTGMSDDEVKHFFINKKEDERVCGRFKQTQLHRIVIELPANIFSMPLPLWKKFLAACLVVFSITLFSCETKIQGTLGIADAKIEKNDRSNETDYAGGVAIVYDSIPEPPQTFGGIVGYSLPIIKGGIDIFEEDSIISKQIDAIIELQGDIALVPEDTEVVIKTDTVPGFIKKGEVNATYTSFTQNKLKINDSITPVKTKNPPKADSINCNTIKNYY
jgi:hypothetical protein